MNVTNSLILPDSPQTTELKKERDEWTTRCGELRANSDALKRRVRSIQHHMEWRHLERSPPMLECTESVMKCVRANETDDDIRGDIDSLATACQHYEDGFAEQEAEVAAAQAQLDMAFELDADEYRIQEEYHAAHRAAHPDEETVQMASGR